MLINKQMANKQRNRRDIITSLEEVTSVYETEPSSMIW